ncbi:unnamed protein product [Aphanomyces euteiches]
MNLIQGKTNQYLREAILENNVEKARKYLTLAIGKADVQATTEHGGFTMLHCAVIIGNTQMVMMLLQLHANIWAISDDGYSALDLALWKGHTQIIEILRSQGYPLITLLLEAITVNLRAIAPMKEPESLNGKKVSHLGREATVVDYFPSTAFRTKSTRALHYATGENYLVNLWAGTDYKIIGLDPNYELYKTLQFIPTEVGMDVEATNSVKEEAIQTNSIPTEVSTLPLPIADKVIEAKFEAALENALDGQAWIDNDDESDDDEDEDEDDDVVVEQTIEVAVPPGPLGVLLDSGIAECAVVQGFTPLPNGVPGAIQASGVVKPGMYIIGINETNASLMSLQQVIQLLGKLARKEKIIRFAVFKPKEAAAPPKPKKEKKQPVDLPPAAPTSANLSDLVSAVRDRRASLTGTPISFKLQDVPTPAPAPPAQQAPPVHRPSETECAHCGLPTTVHLSKDCPYK